MNSFRHALLCVVIPMLLIWDGCVETYTPTDASSSDPYVPSSPVDTPACSYGASLTCYDCAGGREGRKHCLPSENGYGPCECPNHCDQETGSCDACQSCATADNCSEVLNRCWQNQACSSMVDCTKTESLWDCAQKFPSGADDYVALGKCLFCDACPSNCQATGWCENDCITICALKYPYGVNQGITTASCVACDACSADCQSICDNNNSQTCSAGSCGECMAGTCAASQCTQEIATCTTDCQSFVNCIANTCP